MFSSVCRRLLPSASVKTLGEFRVRRLTSCKSSTKVVAIEGNIGSGKTSCLDFLRKDERVDIHLEPVDTWRNVADTNALKLLYADPSRWSFLFNQFAVLGRLKVLTQESTKPIKAVERSIYSSHYVFALNNYNQEDLTDLEFKVTKEWFEFFSSTLVSQKIHHFVYLRSNPETCLSRVKKRGRPEESSLSLEFLTDLHRLHEDLFFKNMYNLPGQVHVVDASRDIPEVEAQLRGVLKELHA